MSRTLQLPSPLAVLLHAAHYCAHDDETVHAIEGRVLLGGDESPLTPDDLTALCGASPLAPVFAGGMPEGKARFMAWPPRVAKLREYDLTRCPACMDAQPKRRPHPDWTAP